MPLAAAESVGTPAINFAIFAFFVLVTLVIAIGAAGKNKSTTDYYAGGRNFTGWQNGIAIGGDYLSAASFLGIAGIIALAGYDGFLYSIGFLVGWLLVLLLVSEPLRNTGRYTMADVIDLRLRAVPVRAAAAISTLTVSLFYLLAQMAGAGALVSLLLGVSSAAGQDIVVAVVGLLMIFYVLVGGMKGTTWVQIVKASILAAGAAVTTLWVLSRAGFSLPALLRHAAAASPAGAAGARPRPGVRGEHRLQVRLHLARAGPRARHGRPAACPDAAVHRAERAGRRAAASSGRSGWSACSTCARSCSDSARCGWWAASRSRPRPAEATPPCRCWPISWAGRCCSASWRRSPSRPSSPWWRA